MDTDGDGHISSMDKKRVNRRSRKKSAIPKEKPSLNTALYTCITMRQLKVVLDLGDEIGKKVASGGCSKEAQENIERLVGSLSKNKATRRVKPSAGLSRSRPRPRKKQVEGVLTRADEYGTTPFDFSSISIGNFNINKESENNQLAVRFCFASSFVKYDFEHTEGDTRYRVGYWYPFDDISLITFLRKTVHITLKKPAQQVECIRQPLPKGPQNSAVATKSSSDNLDVSKGQLASVLLHTIHLKRGNTKVWEDELLSSNRILFEPLIRSTLEPSTPPGSQSSQFVQQYHHVMPSMQPVPQYMRRLCSFQDAKPQQQQHSIQAPPCNMGPTFGSMYGHGSALGFPRSTPMERAPSFEQSNRMMSGGSTMYTRANMYGEYYGGHVPPGQLPPFETLASDAMMASGDRASNVRFVDFSVPGFSAGGTPGNASLFRQYADVPMENSFYRSAPIGHAVAKRERSEYVAETTVASDMAKFGQVVHEAHASLLSGRGDEEQDRVGNEEEEEMTRNGADDSKQEDRNDSFNWLDDLDIEALTGTGGVHLNSIHGSL